jgi:endonuclease III
MTLSPSDQARIGWLLRRHGRTLADELGIDVASSPSSAPFQLLVMALLLSARIGHRIAMKATRAVLEAGWSTPERLAGSTWGARVEVLDSAGYARYDERTARMLGELAGLLLERYGGDLGRLREAAEHDPARERRLLTEIKGIGAVGCDIFFREIQLAWPELFPFADERALRAASRLGLPSTPEALAGLVPRGEFPRLVAALVRAELSGEAPPVGTRDP